VATVAGIDEAGYGPVLGPLVVSASVFQLADETLAADMWAALSSAVCRKPARGGGKVAIADSKKLYPGRSGNGLANLERGVLAMLASGGHRPGSVRGLLEIVAPHCLEGLDEYPWQRDDPKLPRSIGRTEALLAGNALRQAMAGAGMSLTAMRCEPIFVMQYNRHVAATDNKSIVLMDVTSRLLDWIWRKSPPGLIRIYVDRQGGRMRYLPFLQRLLPGCGFRIIDETERFSAYRISGADRRCEICFMTGGEDLRLPVALASMTSKYVRELFMEMFNDYWTGRVPDLARTAGYYTDGRRFYQTICPEARKLGIGQEMLYRSR